MCECRDADPADAMDVAQVHVRAWQAGYRGLLPDDYLDGLHAADRAARYTFDLTGPEHPATIVAATEYDAICGFVTVGGPGDGDPPGTGEVKALYVDPEWWGCGIGRALMGAARTRLTALGYTDAALWVLAGNARAQRFYLRDGWRADGRRRRDEVWGVAVDEVRLRTSLRSGQVSL